MRQYLARPRFREALAAEFGEPVRAMLDLAVQGDAERNIKPLKPSTFVGRLRRALALATLRPIEQLQSLVQPSPTPPRPAEALSVPGSQHMAPDLLLHPVFHEAEALAGVSHRKVVHPTAQHRVDQLHDPINRLRLVAAEHILELA